MGRHYDNWVSTLRTDKTASPSLAFWCRCDVSDPEVGAGHWCGTRILPQRRDLRQREDDFIAVLRLQEANLQGGEDDEKSLLSGNLVVRSLQDLEQQNYHVN